MAETTTTTKPKASSSAGSPAPTDEEEEKGKPVGRERQAYGQGMFPSQAAALLMDPDFEPGPRPAFFDPAENRWSFKERASSRCKRSTDEDRWRNSGGAKGSRDLPAGDRPLVRRRYGRLSKADDKSDFYRYHEYSLLVESSEGGGTLTEMRNVTLFHVLSPNDTVHLPAAAALGANMPTTEQLAAKINKLEPAAAAAAAAFAAAAANAVAVVEGEGGAARQASDADSLPPTSSSPSSSSLCSSSSGGEWTGIYENGLTPDVAVRMLCDSGFEPGCRPPIFDPAGSTSWIFKEKAEMRKKRGGTDDRWRNSGGAKGARNLPAGGAPPIIRRRYGHIVQSGNEGSNLSVRYHEYSLLRVKADGAPGEMEEDRSTTLFHVLPPVQKRMTASGRGKSAKSTGGAAAMTSSSDSANDGQISAAELPDVLRKSEPLTADSIPAVSPAGAAAAKQQAEQPPASLPTSSEQGREKTQAPSAPGPVEKGRDEPAKQDQKADNVRASPEPNPALLAVRLPPLRHLCGMPVRCQEERNPSLTVSASHSVASAACLAGQAASASAQSAGLRCRRQAGAAQGGAEGGCR
jgi:hypothetical protein